MQPAHPFSVKPLIARLHRFFSRARMLFSFRLFVSLSVLTLAVLVLLALDSVNKPWLPISLKALLTTALISLLVSLLIVPLFNRIFAALERRMLLRYLGNLANDEKTALARFVAENRMIDCPLDFPSETVRQLLAMGIVSPGSGILYPKSELNEKPYAYFSIPNWIFQHLKDHPFLIEIADPQPESNTLSS